MSRSRDLDTVAPDDKFNNSQPVTPKAAPQEPASSESMSDSPQKSKTPTAEIRQKIDSIMGKTTSPFSSFLVHPKVFNFREKDDREEILLVLRQHWFTNLGWILTAVAMCFLPSLFSTIPVFDFLPLSYLFVAGLFWYMITFAFAFEKFLSWYFDVYIITDERVVDIDFNNLLNKHFAEAQLNAIQDVSSQVIGLPATMFNYGHIRIQTASEIPEIEFENVPNPEKVIKVLQQLRAEEEQEAIEGRVR